MFGSLPDGAYARMLDTAIRPFDAVDYLGSWAGSTTLTTHRMTVMFNHVIAKLHQLLDAETEADLASACTTRPAGTRSSPTT